MNPLRLVGAALLTAAIACGDATGPKAGTTDLDAARARWRSQDLHTYAFILQRSCFCVNIHPLYVAVVNDTVAGVIDFETVQPVDVRLGQTIDDLFAFIQDANDRHARLIRAEYDGTRGFPTTIDYDGAEQIADDEIFFTISDVHPIEPQQ